MASQSDILQSCLQEASRAAGPVLERCIDEAVTWLQAAESLQIRGVNRDDVSNAQRELLKNKSAWARRYPADLLVRFKTELAAAGRARSAPGSLQDRSFAATTLDSTLTLRSIDSLSLVDDAKISHQIESSRLMQNILPTVEHAVAELNTLMSTIQGLPNVRPDLNPLRPEVFTETLQEIMFAEPVEPVITSLWLRCMAEPLGRELKKLYEGVVDLPQMANVSGASYRVMTSPSGSRRSGGSGSRGEGENSATGFGPLSGYGTDFGDLPRESGDSSRGTLAAAQPPQYADLSNYEIRDELFQDFLFHGGSNASHKLTPAYYATVERELTALRDAPDSGEAPLAREEPDYQRLPAVDRPPRFVNELTQLSQEVWGDYGRSRARAIVRTELKKEAKQVGQVLGLEVVRKLVNQVAQDPRLLVPVREAIVALEPSLLRLAMVDPRFFSDEGHAGRRLMEQVAQRSFKYNDEYSAEFLAFFDPVIQAFNELNNRLIENVEPFSAALATLEYSWDEQDQLEAESRNKVMEALRFAEERQHRAELIAADLSKRPDLDNVPGLILDFLFGPWALAMAHAQLIDTRNQMDPMGLGLVVPDLVWSVKREATLKQPGKLIQMIPGLLSRLHSGLDLLGHDRRESEPFFDQLMDLHHPVLKLRRMKSQQDAMESGAMPLEPEELPATPEERLAKAAAHHPWLGREELDAAGFEDTMPSEPAELTAQADEKASPPPAAPVAAAPTEQAGEMKFLDEAEPTEALSADQATSLLLMLQAGCWVDLYSKRRWLRAQLVWASTKGTLFMFVSHGGQPHSMTKRSCERLIRERFLRPVDSQGVVAQALDAVASEVTSQAPASRSFDSQPA